MMSQSFFERCSGKSRWWFTAAGLVVCIGLSIGAYRLPTVKWAVASAMSALTADSPNSHSPRGSEIDSHDHGKIAFGEHGRPGSLDDAHADEDDDRHDEDGDHHDHDSHEHSAAEAQGHKHEEATSVKLSQAAQENVGLRLVCVELQTFQRTTAVPAMVIERPGRSVSQISAPLTGVVTRIWPLQGESVVPGQPLFDLRLTHEEVVEAQAEFLRTAEELDVLKSEIARLEKISADGAIAGKNLLQRQYEQQKSEALLRAQRQRLLLHGLSAARIDEIGRTRRLVKRGNHIRAAADRGSTPVAIRTASPNQ